jgi:hypothetical protein
MTLPNPNPALPDYPNPYFQDNSFVRGDNQRANNGFIWGNLEDLDDRVTIIEDGDYIIRGAISGGIAFDTVLTPPIILPGSYEVNGKLINLDSEYALTTADVLGAGSPALTPGIDDYLHFIVMMDDNGNKKFMMYGESVVTSGTISSITGSGTAKTLTVATGTASSAFNKILLIVGNNGYPVGSFKITGGNGSTTYEFEGPNTLTGGASGSWFVYERISTRHGTGTNTAITSDGSIQKYSPGYGDNGWAASFVAFDDTRNGYYLTIAGYTNYRVIGSFFTGSVAVVSKTIISHKTGRNKNDNEWYLQTSLSLVSTAMRFSTINKLQGNDYLYIDNGSVASRMEILRPCDAKISAQGIFTSSDDFFILTSASDTNSVSQSSTDQMGGASVSNTNANIFVSKKLYINQYVKILGGITASLSNARWKFIGNLELI